MKRRGFLEALGSISLGIMLATPFDMLTKEKKTTTAVVVTGRNQNGEFTKESYEIELPYTEKQLQALLLGESLMHDITMERVLSIDIVGQEKRRVWYV